jgi:peptidylprolyl isomerase
MTSVRYDLSRPKPSRRRLVAALGTLCLSLGALLAAPNLAAAAAASAPPATPPTGTTPVPEPVRESLDLENALYLDLEYGRVVIKLHPELAPKHVARIKELARQGFYDGLIWHRVIDGFMAQGGDPKGDGTGGSGQNIPAEFNGGRHVRGALSMARAANINSADSQFFIVLQDSPHLNGQYTYWGEVVSGMEFVDRIRKGDAESNGMVPYPDRIIRMQVAADAEKAGDKWPRQPAATDSTTPPPKAK